MDPNLVTDLAWTAIIAAAGGLYYVTRAAATAQADRAILIRKKRNGARLISVNGRLLQERLSIIVMFSFLAAGAVTQFAPLGWARGSVVPFLVIGIVVTALKSFFRTKYRNRAVRYLDKTIPPTVPLDIAEHIAEDGTIDPLASLEGGK